MFTYSFLSFVRRRALRRGIWYKALDGVERGIVELSCRVVDEVKSLDLARVIVRILAKLRDASKSPFSRHVERVGLVKARRVVEQALELGCVEAGGWLSEGFARYLAFIDFNHPSGWGLPST